MGYGIYYDNPTNFSENLDILKIMEIETSLDNLIHENNSNQSDINKIVNDISSFFEKCSLKTFGMVRQKGHKPKKYKQPWFNKECIKIRNLYHKARQAYNKHKTIFYKTILKDISKQYKNVLSKNKKTI